MENEKKNEELIPLDRKIIQDSLLHIAQGPDVFMKWVRENYELFDQKFLNQLRKMTEYTEKNGQQKEHKLFQFLETCFQKTLGKQGYSELTAITKENFHENLQLANLYLKKQQHIQAIPIYQALLAFLQLQPNNMQKAIIDANIGISYAQIHNTQQAIQHLQKAIESTELPEESKEKICSNLANVYQNTKQYKEAIKYHQLAIQKAEERNDKRMQSIHLSNLALVYLDQKDIENAIKTQKQSYDISMKLGALDILKDNMTKLAMLHGINNQPDLCRKYCEQGLLLLKNPNLGIE